MDFSFKIAEINDVFIRHIKKHVDERGWLAELYRNDEIDKSAFPEMAYISLTMPNIKRGPHEHTCQTDYFCFLGPSDFKIILWDNRKDSPTYLHKTVLFLGENTPAALIVPPGIVHAYKNIGEKNGLVINAANKLYAGKSKKEPVDEIRHESDIDTIFIFD
ncbi:dTDP-4-dehydrorhamnose 3,5-epimerase family protein [Candidatus Acidulodesulfobacterium sp. H_13]|uniref:dTDP-4-dehydrorhamnose 3,5-epimerase family protein n=1 Tax=Candidatus Acidulodesulfobacterium sp. H_13 TaxID=3395470 RepID=UPI003AF7BA8C